MNLRDLIGAAIVSTRADAIIGADRNGIIRYWNPGAERIFGYSRDEAEGRTLDVIIPDRLRARHWDGYTRTMQSCKTRYGERDLLSVPALRKDGVTISIEFTVVLIKHEGQIAGTGAIVRDVTARFQEMKALKRKLAELEAKSDQRFDADKMRKT